jgi:hypothetical protein
VCHPSGRQPPQAASAWGNMAMPRPTSASMMPPSVSGPASSMVRRFDAHWHEQSVGCVERASGHVRVRVCSCVCWHHAGTHTDVHAAHVVAGYDHFALLESDTTLLLPLCTFVIRLHSLSMCVCFRYRVCCAPLASSTTTSNRLCFVSCFQFFTSSGVLYPVSNTVLWMRAPSV